MAYKPKFNKGSISILELKPDEAREYFLKGTSYCNFNLPPYFNFEDILLCADSILGDEELSSFTAKKKYNKSVRDLEKVNYKILSNKDGKYAWRPFQLINPMLYAFLVRKITSKQNWEFIQKRFNEFNENENIDCLSIPRISRTKKSDTEEQILNWWHPVEQDSIKFALNYSYLTHTDLTDCYGSIYTHSIAWAMHTKKEAKERRWCKELIGNQIDDLLLDMSQGQTNGIPQGSTLMDFIAEMVLGYADIKLGEALEKEEIEDYKILRYRDDYRIFSKSLNDNKTIIKALAEVMIGLGFKLNPDKTNTSNNLIEGAIKKDKLFWMRQKQINRNLQEHLLSIHNLSMKFPNSGSLKKSLIVFFNKLEKLKRKPKEDIIVLISIMTDIAHKNPRIYEEATAIIGLLLKFEKNALEKKKLLDKIIEKFNDIPNTGHLDIWIQRMILKTENSKPLKEPLCNLVYKKVDREIKNDEEFQNHFCELTDKNNEKIKKHFAELLHGNDNDIAIWNFSWLKNDFKNKLDILSIIDKKEILELPSTVSKEEIKSYATSYDY